MTGDPSHDVGTRLLFENEAVRVWDFALQPGESLERHVHETDYLFIVTEGGALRITEPDDPSAFRDVHYETDLVRYVPVSGSKVDNRHTNIGTTPYRNLVIELKQAQGK